MYIYICIYRAYGESMDRLVLTVMPPECSHIMNKGVCICGCSPKCVSGSSLFPCGLCCVKIGFGFVESPDSSVVSRSVPFARF